MGILEAPHKKPCGPCGRMVNGHDTMGAPMIVTIVLFKSLGGRCDVMTIQMFMNQ